MPPPWKPEVGGWAPLILRITLPHTDPIHPPSPSGGETSVNPPSWPAVPFMVPTLMTLVSTAVVWTYGSLIIPVQDVIEGGQWHRIQTLMWGIPWGIPSPHLFPDLLVFAQREFHSPGIRPRSLFLKCVGSASLGLWVRYSPISGGVKAHGTWGPVFHSSLLNLRVNLTIAGLRAMIGHKPSRY